MSGIGIYFVVENEEELPQYLINLKPMTKKVILIKEGEGKIDLDTAWQELNKNENRNSL